MDLLKKILILHILFLQAGMLVFVFSCGNDKPSGHYHEISGLDSGIIVPPNEVALSDQGTVKVINETMEGTIAMPGTISFDPRRNERVAARFSGRIEKLYFRYNNQYVKKGEKIMDIYSPELNTFQDEYLYLYKSSDDKILLMNARNKLKLLGLTDAQIDKLEKTGVLTNSIYVFSPQTGYLNFEDGENEPVISSNENTESMSSNKMANDVSSKPEPMKSVRGERIREGAYVAQGQTLFSINDIKEVWAVFSLENKYQSILKTGEDIEVSSELLNDQIIETKVDFIEPEFKAGQKFIQIRSYLKNPQFILKVNSLVTGKISLEGAKKIQVLTSSIYDLGTRKIVWVYTGKKNGTHKEFERRNVVTGITAGELTEIIHGLEGSEEIAKDAGYLIDSESFLPTDSL